MPPARGAWLAGRHYAHRTGDHGFCASDLRRFMRLHGLALHSDALWRYDARLRVWTVLWPPRAPGAPSAAKKH